MKVFALGAIIATIASASSVTIEIQPDPHFSGIGCIEIGDVGDERIATSYERFLCELRNAAPYDSIACWLNQLHINWRHESP